MAIVLILGSWASAVAAQDPAVPVRSALEPATTGGLEVVDRALAKLSTHRRVLLIGAHPDDEDTSLLTLVARGWGGEAAYLALSRGDGGQNLIGPELGVGLGVIRTQELLSARRVDGAHQFFTRGFDFGYIRSLEETLKRWPREVLMEDAARVVWRFRPQVIVAMFTPEGGGGHGQHRAAGWVAQEVFPVSGRGDRFPRLLEEGWVPWQPQAFFRRSFFDRERATLEVSVSAVDGLSGRSMLQIAMESRSQHRSQDMGMLQPLGTRTAGLEWVAGVGGPESDDLFSGIDTRLAAIAGSIPEGEVRRTVEQQLEAVEDLARTARLALTPAVVGAAIDSLAEILSRLRRARASAEGSTDEAAGRVVQELIAEKIAVAEAALAAAAGVGLEATCDREAMAPGQAASISIAIWNGGGSRVELRSVEILASEDWTIAASSGAPESLEPGAMAEWELTATVVPEARATVPYYLETERQGDLYDWSSAAPVLRGLPQQAPELLARVRLEIGGEELALSREVVHRVRDQARGEIRRPIRIVPQTEIAVEPTLLLWNPGKDRSREVRVTLISHAERPIRGRIATVVPDGWRASEPSFEIDEPHGRTTVKLEVTAEESMRSGFHELAFEARLDDGSVGRIATPLLEYSHIRPTPLAVEAQLNVSVFELTLPEIGTVGYVRGASDRVPEFLRQVGLDVEMLDGEELARGELSRFHTIVVGSRAYETDAALVASNSRLLDFVRQGGTLIVQYQQYQFSRGAHAPFGFEIARPHDRITDETAPVRLLEPDHPALTTPNRLVASDWNDWVQERGLYFARSWGNEFTPLLAIRDPGLDETAGGLLVADLGEGTYVYTGLAFFRQLPAGVAGGYRLLTNLMALD